MTRVPDVTAVTVTYDAAGLVGRCLRALAAQELGDLTMRVVVDNASNDGTPDLVAREFPDVTLVRDRTNLGFAGGNNTALRDVTSPWVVLLNNDTVPEPTFVRTLVETIKSAAPTVAAVAARVLLLQRFTAAPAEVTGAVIGPDGRWLPDDDGEVELVNSTGNEVRLDGYGPDRGWLASAEHHHPDRRVFGFSGAAAVLRRSALERVGLFDDALFMYYEDTDLSWRMRRAGFRVEYAAEAIVRHEHSASSGEGSDFFRFHDLRNRLVVLTKNASVGLVLRCLLRYALMTL